MLSLQNISLYNGSIPLLENCTITIDGNSKKKIALVGKNGSGKSSLLKLLIGEYTPDKGVIVQANEIIGYLPQEISFSSHFTLAGEYLENLLPEPWMEYKIDIALDTLNLPTDFLLKDIHRLSGGEKVKLALVGLLLQDPTILLFDEPTNNLDSDGIIWLEGFMKEFLGTILFVSHDRALINNVSTTIWEIDHENYCINTYGGNYDDFLNERTHRREKQLQQYEAQYQEIKEIEDWLTAHEFHPKYRFSSIVAGKKNALENCRKNFIKKPLPDPSITPGINTAKNKGLVLKIQIEKKVFPEKEILNNTSLTIRDTEKILIVGPNGAGKTTLLNILADQDKDFKGKREAKDDLKIGYLHQFNDLDPTKTLLETFLYHTYTTETEARSVLATYLFPTEFINSKVSMLSSGELRRLNLAILLTNKPNLLLLDEPTNHLDIFSREALEQFIIETNLPMVIVSHDRYFIEKVGIETIITLNSER